MAGEVIVFPDVEGLAIQYLNGVLPDTAVSTKIPNPRPTRLIRVQTVGGNKRRINADSTMVTFQCWEADTVKASELARLARAHVHAMAGYDINGVWVYKVTDVGAPAYNQDPDTDAPRYQFTVMIDLKGVTLNG